MRQALELALEALTYIYTETTADEDELIDKAIIAIKEALAQPEQEPVGCIPWHWVDKAKQIADGTIAYPDVERARQAIALIKILLKSTPQPDKLAYYEKVADDLQALCDKQSLRIAELEAQPEQEPVPVTDNTYGYAKSLAEAMFKQHFSSDEHYASGRIVWGVNDSVIGILTQIDNMVADMVRKPAQPEQEPVAWVNWCAATGKRSVSFECESELASQPLYTKEQS